MALEVKAEAKRDYAEELKAKFRAHTAVVAVVGIGYVGLPLAVEKASEPGRKLHPRREG